VRRNDARIPTTESTAATRVSGSTGAAGGTWSGGQADLKKAFQTRAAENEPAQLVYDMHGDTDV
jgi:hypothetical protein